ncbi:MAG: flavodoxin [Phascolarctobacterium sp.]|nr:flavodoxin [Phascolarctobacterium sp.]
MKKILSILALSLALLTMLMMSGCASNSSDKKADSSSTSVMATAHAQENSKVLVAYFSWGGNTRRLAQEVKRITGGDIFEIATEQPYPTSYHACVSYAKEERANNIHPALKNPKVTNLQDYDTILIGFPVWWYDAPMAVFSFLDENDLSGKNVAFFATSGGTQLETCMPRLRKALPNSRILEGITANGVDIYPWLNGLGLAK